MAHENWRTPGIRKDLLAQFAAAANNDAPLDVESIGNIKTTGDRRGDQCLQRR